MQGLPLGGSHVDSEPLSSVTVTTSLSKEIEESGLTWGSLDGAGNKGGRNHIIYLKRR